MVGDTPSLKMGDGVLSRPGPKRHTHLVITLWLSLCSLFVACSANDDNTVSFNGLVVSALGIRAR